ncbi:aldo/keto reductase [Streptomyces sp. NPDC090021]|uniref:aldo/keto reductase n=1 Tax=Streptomyces sp. NPDC090021 TaxID=3365919 RepID=UPI003819E5DB
MAYGGEDERFRTAWPGVAHDAQPALLRGHALDRRTVDHFPVLLTGKIRRGAPVPAGSRLEGRDSYLTEERLDVVEALAAIAEKHDRTVLELAIGWLSARPGCASVIAGATSPEQIRANAAAGERPLDADLLAEIDAIAPGVPA